MALRNLADCAGRRNNGLIRVAEKNQAVAAKRGMAMGTGRINRVLSGGVVVVLALAIASCGGGSTGSGSGSPTPSVPTISGMQPSSGPEGSTVAVNGTNFTGASAVSFNGMVATFAVNSATQITATVPTGATTGKVSVTTPNGAATSSGNFTVTTAPSITSFAPTSGPAGTSVVITGANLTGATALTLNGTAATYTVNSATQITATVPSGATTGKFSVTTPGGTASSSSNFTVTAPPAISSFTPTSGPVATPVIISGSNFTGATAVTLNGASATFTVNSGTQITATVPTGATTGKFSVTTPLGSATSANSFTVNTSSSTLDLSVDGLYITQATQDYPAASVPLVKDRSGWVRVFVKANVSNTATPQVKVDFINGSTTNTLTINAPGASVPTSIDPNTNASWNAAVSSAWIQPGTQVVATVDPSGLISEADETNNQFTQNLDVRTLHPWKVTLIPVKTTDGKTGVVESGSFTRTNWGDFAKQLHPVPDAIDVTVAGSTLNSSVASLAANGTGWSTVLNEISARRTADGAAASDRYYFGVVKVGYTSGVAGLGFIGFPAAMGWDYQSSAPGVFAHEEGHNFNSQHSPCAPPGVTITGVDPAYPYPNAIIGVPGWDAFASSGNLKDENTFTDIMGYCSNQWISDYVYKSELSYRASQSFDVVGADVVNGTSNQDALLVWGRIENGNVILEPAFKVKATGIAPQPGPYTWQAKDALGTVLMTLPFDAPEVADLPNTSLRMFSFVVPMSAGTMSQIASVHLSKDGGELTRMTAAANMSPMMAARAVARQQYLPNHKMQFSWDATQSPMVMLRDATTGEVRGFLRGGSATIDDVPDDLEVQFSDGIHASAVEYKRPAE
jgi:hypothetical protein